MNRHALLSLGLLITGIAAAVPGCGEATSNGKGNKAGDAGAAGKDAGGEQSGGTGTVVKPSAGAGGEGGAKEALGGSGGSPEGGSNSAGAGGVAAGAGGVAAGAGGAGGAGGEGGGAPDCDVASAFGALGLVDGIADEFGGELPGAGWQGDLPSSGAYTTHLRVDLYDGYGPFDPVRKPLTNHVIAGDDLNFQTCGVCVYIRQLSGLEEKLYFATGGTVTVTSVEGRVTGSASNLTFEEVTIDDDFLTTPVPGGCESSIASVSFDESTGEGGAGGAGG